MSAIAAPLAILASGLSVVTQFKNLLSGTNQKTTDSLIPTGLQAYGSGEPGGVAPQLVSQTNLVPDPSQNQPTTSPTPTTGGTAQVSTPPTESDPGFFDKGGFLERNQTLIGSVIGGIGKGLLTQSEQKSRLEGAREARAATAANFGSGGRGLLTRADIPETESPSQVRPVDRFTPLSGPGQWVFDPAQGRLVFVPNQAG